VILSEGKGLLFACATAGETPALPRHPQRSKQWCGPSVMPSITTGVRALSCYLDPTKIVTAEFNALHY